MKFFKLMKYKSYKYNVDALAHLPGYTFFLAPFSFSMSLMKMFIPSIALKISPIKRDDLHLTDKLYKGGQLYKVKRANYPKKNLTFFRFQPMWFEECILGIKIS